jgi:hypothetical protein
MLSRLHSNSTYLLEISLGFRDVLAGLVNIIVYAIENSALGNDHVAKFLVDLMQTVNRLN